MEKVNNPVYYGGDTNPYEAIKVIEAWGLGFCLGNVVKYISRAGKKDAKTEIEDLEKAEWYLKRRINQLKETQNENSITQSKSLFSCFKQGFAAFKKRVRNG